MAEFGAVCTACFPVISVTLLLVVFATAIKVFITLLHAFHAT